MTHDYKAALDAVNKCKTAEDGVIAYGSILSKHLATIEEALTLAAEHERVKKERDELAFGMELESGCFTDEDSAFLSYARKLAKKVRNENA